MKNLIAITCLIIATIGFSQTPAETRDNKHSVGIYLNAVNFERFVSTANASRNSITEAQHRFFFAPISNCGIAYQYRLNNFLKFRLGGGFYSERVETRTFEKGFDGNIIDKTIKGKLSYVSIPLSIRLFPLNIYNEESNGGFYMELGCNSDFIYNEQMSSHNNIPFSKFSASQIPSYVTVYRESVEYKNKNFSYNRSSITFGLGHEVELKHIAFSYGINTQFESFSQMKNTFADIRTAKFCLMNIGWSYRF